MNGMSLAWLLIGGSLCSVMVLLVLLWLLWLERRSQRGCARKKPTSPSCVGKSSCCGTEICC